MNPHFIWHFGHDHSGGGWRGFGGRFGGPGFTGGPRSMRAAKMLTSGELQLVILALISQQPRHGYEIIKALEEHSSGFYAPSPGMVYPALTYLEEAGHTESEADGARKRYRITETGAAFLAQHLSEAEAELEELSRYGRRMAHARALFDEEAKADEWASDPRVQARRERVAWRQMTVEFHELRRELKMAIFEKLAAPVEEKRRVLEVLRRAVEEIRRGS